MLVSLSKQFGLVCSLTSFIAIEHRSLEERNEGKPALRRIPTQLAAGWGGALGDMLTECVAGVTPFSFAAPAAGGGLAARARALFKRPKKGKMPPPPPSMAMAEGAYSPPPPQQTPDAGSGLFDLTREVDDASFGSILDEVAPPPPAQHGLTRLLALQSADGWFAWDDNAAEPREHLDASVAGWLGSAPDGKVLSTVAALVRLRARHPGEHDLWRRAERKALKWLADAVHRPQADVDAWLDTLAADPQLASQPGA
jgi:hypothetical protein